MKSNTIYFIVLAVLILAVSFLSKELLNTEELIVNSLAEQLTSDQLSDLLVSKEKWQWLSYIAIPLLLLIKTSIIAAIIDAGLFFFEKEIKYKKLFNFVLKAEFVFLLAAVLKTLWFYIFKQDFNFEDLQYFYPLSILNIIGYEELQTWFIYPLQVVNLLEITYWLILAYLIGQELKIKLTKGLLIVASSYGICLLIWVVGVMFFTLNMS